MKMISVIAIALTLPLAHAMEPTHAKVINIKEWTTNNAKATFRVMPTVKKLSGDANYNSTDIFAKTTAQTGTTTAPNTYTSDNNVYYANETDQEQTISFNLYTCIVDNNWQNQDHFTNQCAYHDETVSVPARSGFSKHFSPQLIVSFSKAGEYRLESATVVHTINSTNERRISASGGAVITVS